MKGTICIPDGWMAAVQAVRNITGAYTIIAGGACRDLVLDREVRDLDLWIRGFNSSSVTLGEPPAHEYDVMERGIIRTHSFVWEGLLTDLITVSRPLHEVVESFSVGLSQFWAGPDGLVKGTDLAWKDLEDKALTVKPYAYPPYVEKVQRKYPEFTLR